MHTEFETYFLMLFHKNWIRYMSTTSLRTLVSFSIAQQPEVIIINNVLQQYFFDYVFIQFLIKFADKML